MNNRNYARNAMIGAVAGLAGTMALQALMKANKKVAPQTMPQMHQEPGEYMVKHAEAALPEQTRRQIPKSLEKASAATLGIGYGSTAAAIYTAFRSRPRTLLDGAALGLGVWAIGYLGWIPALGIGEPVTRQKKTQVLDGMMHHVAFGIATVEAFRKLREATTHV